MPTNSTASPTRRRPGASLSLLMLLALGLLLTGCGSLLQVPASSTVPPLPPQARQPATEAICSPSCSGALSTWLESLMKGVRPGMPASGPTRP